MPILSRRTQVGFTLVELMVTLSILAILAALALPSFQTFMAENRASGKTMELVSAVKTAQSEALRRSREVVFTLTDSPNPSASLTGVATGKSWATVALPLAGASSSVVPEVVTVGGYSEGSADVVIKASTAAVCFLPDGPIKADTATGVSGADCAVDASSGATFVLLPSRGTKRWRVSVTPAGKVSSCLGVGDDAATFTCS